MKTVVSEAEVNRVATDAITLALQKLPYNGQDEQDRTLAEHFLLKELNSKVGARLRKLDDKAKTAYENGDTAPVVTENYRMEITESDARMLFDLDMFIDMIVKAYPKVLAHHLREMAVGAKKASKPPKSINIEYIGDVVKKELP